MTTFKAKIPLLGSRGPAGNTIIEVANVAPGAEAGAVGDVAFRYDDNGETWLYHKKTEGGWPAEPRPLKGNTGDQGAKGWSPLLAVVPTVNDRLVMQLVDWVGGQGAKPAGAGKYLGQEGFVDNIADARFWGYSTSADAVLFDNEAAQFPGDPDDVQGALDAAAAVLANKLDISGGNIGNPAAQATFRAAIGAAAASERASVLIAEAVASNDAAIVFSLPSTYFGFELAFAVVQPATDGANFILEVSNDGSTWVAASYRFAGYIARGEVSSAVFEENVAASFGVTANQGSVSARTAGGTLCIRGRANPRFELQCAWLNAAGNLRGYSWVGHPAGLSGNLSHIRLRYSSGVIASGRFALYGKRGLA